MDYELEREMQEEVYEINESPKRKVGLNIKQIHTCGLCRKIIDSPKYICSVLVEYKLRTYYHKPCYIRYLQFQEMENYDYDY